ncbi:hypothetical protein AALB51_10535 [Lachnospiraceae bacterium 62-26]
MGILNYAGRSLRTVTAIMLGLCVISGCARRESAESEEEPYTIGVVTKSRDSEYWMSVFGNGEGGRRLQSVCQDHFPGFRVQ